MFIGNHRVFSRVFRDFRPFCVDSRIRFNAKNAIAFRWFAPGWFAAKFALEASKLKGGLCAAHPKYVDPSRHKLGVKSAHGSAVRYKIKPSTIYPAALRNQGIFIVRNRYTQACRIAFYHQVLPNVRRYFPSLTAPWSGGVASVEFGRSEVHLNGTWHVIKYAPKPPFGGGFGDGWQPHLSGTKGCFFGPLRCPALHNYGWRGE